MKLLYYTHINRTIGNITGIGRHIVNILFHLNSMKDLQGTLLVAEEWVSETGELTMESALPKLPVVAYPGRQINQERLWKTVGFPRLDYYVNNDMDWVYAPMETFLPIKKRPVAITIHDIHPFEPNVPWAGTRTQRLSRLKWRIWIHRAIRESRIVFTVSEFSKKRMIELLNAPEQKIINVGNGIDHVYFDIAHTSPDSLSPRAERPYVMIIGGLKFKKGADYVLRVAHQLKERGSELKIYIAGNNDDKYLAQAESMSNVKLLGFVADDQMPVLLRCASSLLFLSHYEGFGLPAIEAMAAGVPAVVANRASLPEVVGEAGIVVEPEDAPAIAFLLDTLEEDISERNSWIDRGKRHARNFTWEACANRVLKALHSYS